MRLKYIRLIYFLFLVVIVARLSYWQIWKSEDLVALAEGQRVSSSEVAAPRGDILFSDGSVLVSNKVSFQMFAQPKVIADKLGTAKKLAAILSEVEYGKEWKEQREKITEVEQLKTFDLEKDQKVKLIEEDLMKNFSKDLFWVSLGWRVDNDTRLEIDKLRIEGIGFDQKLVRFYPESSSAAHLVGFIGADAYGIDKGYFGLEGYYNGELRGKKGLITQERDAHGLPILLGNYDFKDPSTGKTLMLTVDRTIQTVVEEKLKKGIEKYGAKGASAVVMDPYSGGILAMASYPNYDPGKIGDFPKEYFRNPVTVDGYEPGSTFKVLVMAAAINEGLVTPETICTICDKPVEMSGFTIRTWNNKYTANSTMTDVIVHSDNTGMVFIAEKLGIQKMYEYIANFGFGHLTGVDLEDEYSPDLRELDTWKPIDLATASFGQGISVTALQVVRAVAAIANGGHLMEPRVVSVIKTQNGITRIDPREIGKPITPQTAALVKEMMVQAVDLGESKFAKPKGYRIAGKTGTAQIAVGGTYDAKNTIASFVGFAPADDPKFVMLVRYDQPTSSIYGAETAAPTFFDIAREIFTYYGIPPTN